MARYLILFIFLLISCATPPPRCINNSNNFTKNYTFYVSDEFTPVQQKLIIGAIDEWGKALEPILIYKASVIHLSNKELLRTPFDERLRSIIQNEIFIMKTSFDEAPTDKTAAFYTKQYLLHYIGVLDKSLELYNTDLYKAVIIHEIGHAFGLEHINKQHKSIMYYNINKASLCISAIDLEELCKLWCCMAKDLHPCLEPKIFVLGNGS